MGARATSETTLSGLFAALAALDLSHTEVCAAAYFLLVAGHETTTQLVSTVLWRWRVSHSVGGVERSTSPAQGEALVDDVLRSQSSVPTWRRVATRRRQLGGVTNFPRCRCAAAADR